MFKKTKKAVALAMAALLTVHTAPELVMNAATTGWKFVVREQTPVDRVYFDTEDRQTGERYLIGYKDKKVTIVDMDGKIVANTMYTGVGMSTVLYDGKTTLVVEKDGKQGLVDLKGKEMLPCSYKYIRMLDSFDGHTLISYTNTDDSKIIKIDNQHILETVDYGYFRTYKNELVIAVSRQDETSLYDIYDLTGKKKDTITFNQLYEEDYKDDDSEESEDGALKSYCDKAEGKEKYAKAKEEWLLAKEDELMTGIKAYFSGSGADFKSEDVFSGYQCLNGKMYYFLAADGEIRKKTIDTDADAEEQNENWDYLANVSYVQIYDENQNLISQGQTNLEKEKIVNNHCNEAVPFIVYVLDWEGNLLKFDAEKGCMEKVFIWEKGAVFCQKYNYSGDTAEQNKVRVYIYLEDYSVTRQSYGKPDLYATYRTNAFVSVNEKKAYFPVDKSSAQYDFFRSDVELFLNDTQDNQTEVYYATTKMEKLSTVKESIQAFGLGDNWNSGYFRDGWDENGTAMYYLVNKTKGKVYFIGKDFSVTETCKDNLLTDLSGTRVFLNKEKGGVAFLAEPVTYDEFGNENIDTAGVKCRIALLDRKTQTVKWQDMPVEVYRAFESKYSSLKDGDIHYSISGQKIYLIDFTKNEYKETDLTDVMEQKNGKVENVIETNDELYVRYSVLDGETKYYGYADIDGKIVFDATVLKITDPYLDIKKIGDYFLCKEMLIDKDYNLVSRKASYNQLVTYDEEKKVYENGEFYVIYSKDENEKVGFVYDTKRKQVIFDFKDTGKKYYYGRILEDYIILDELDNSSNSICLNKTTGKLEKEFINHYKILDTENKCYYAFMLKDEQTVGGNEETPEASTKPEESSTPAASTKPEESSTPAASTKPEESNIPAASTKPEESNIPVASAKPEESNIPVASTKPEISTRPETSSTPTVTPAPQATKAPTVDKVQNGKSYVVGKQTFKVTSTTAKTVTLTKTANKGTTETIPATVKIKGKTYKVTTIADNVYKDNKKIKKVVIGSNIKTIGKNVWKNCKNLTTIQIKTKVLAKVGSSAIKGTSTKLKISVPSGKKKTYQKLWKGKGNDKAKIG